MKRTFASILFAVLAASSLFAQGYKQPPKEVLDVLNIPASPSTSVSPARDRIAMLTPLRYPPIAELAQPMLRLGGIRINPDINGRYGSPYFVSVVLKNIADGSETKVALPQGARIVSPQWSADGKYIAAGNITANGVELWVIETATAKATLIKGVKLNTTLSSGFSWMPDQRSLLVNLVAEGLGPAPKRQDVTPEGPSIQETAGRAGAVQTVQDLLKSPNDEKLFEYYTTSQIAKVTMDGKVTKIGRPAIYDNMDGSPDGKYLLVSTVQKPFSYLFPYSRFPKTLAVWDMSGKMVRELMKSPLQDALPVGGVPTGPRSVSWIPTEAATLMWAEAMDGGDPRKKITPRDQVKTMAAPFDGDAKGLIMVEERFQGRAFGERNGVMFFYDFNRDTNRRRMFMTDYRNPAQVTLLSDLNTRDRYNDPGTPVTKMLPNGFSVVIMDGEAVYMTGAGASPEGDRPFLRRMTLSDKQTVEMFRSSADSYETFVALLNDKGFSFITRKESLTSPPNLFKWTGRAAPMPLTDFKDPAPQLRGIKKQLVKYKRADGVDLSFTLYLPPNYKEGERLPTVLWAYPLEFTDASTAGQVSGSTNRFTTIGGYSHLFFLMQGYAVLDETTMPIVGDPEKVNDTFIEQIVASAKAAIDKGVEMGVVDPERVGVGGHSYGAFMTANLLAHSDLFRAGIARSGAYNRTLTPFGFQSERRSFWEAQSLYTRVSPFFYADKIKEPILFIHGEADNNQGTFPIQSERMYAAVQGNGGTARLVMLPLESHGYSARESTEHTIHEQLEWFDKYVKNAKPRK
jgi:dipeptidyl aminopeptidase/acylaminoacyl peptidase